MRIDERVIREQQKYKRLFKLTDAECLILVMKDRRDKLLLLIAIMLLFMDITLSFIVAALVM